MISHTCDMDYPCAQSLPLPQQQKISVACICARSQSEHDMPCWRQQFRPRIRAARHHPQGQSLHILRSSHTRVALLPIGAGSSRWSRPRTQCKQKKSPGHAKPTVVTALSAPSASGHNPWWSGHHNSKLPVSHPLARTPVCRVAIVLSIVPDVWFGIAALQRRV
jgi:hypothetical protein